LRVRDSTDRMIDVFASAAAAAACLVARAEYHR
jgi:hypothetical protein